MFLGVHEIAGYYNGLSVGFEAIGINATRLITQKHKFEYSKPTLLERYCQWLTEKAPLTEALTYRDRLFNWYVNFFEWMLIKWATHWFDIFIFGFGKTLDGCISGKGDYADLRKIRAANKTIILVFHGSDVRPPWLNGALKRNKTNVIVNRTKKRIRNLKIMEASADVVVSHPPMAIFQRKKYAHYLAVGVPLIMQAPSQTHISTKKYIFGKSITRILHAPSNPEFKGTPQIETVIDRLKSEGHLIDYIRIQNMPNAEVQRQLSQADFVVDQLYSDTPMAHFAAEAAMHQLPAVVCGNDLKTLKSSILPEFWPPSKIGEPSELYDLIKDLIEKPKERSTLGKLAHKFVTENWSADKTASRFIELAKGNTPKEWFKDPTQPPYFLGGWGLSLKQASEFSSRISDEVGVEALGKPQWYFIHDDK